MVPYAWTQVVNIKRDPFETTVGSWQKTLMGVGGAIAAPMTAYQYDWNMLPIGQALWLKELQSYIDFPPLQEPGQLQSGSGHEAGPGDEVERGK